MKMKVSFLFVAGLLALLMFLYEVSSRDNSCENLKRVSNDGFLTEKIWRAIIYNINNPSDIQSAGFNKGLIYAQNTDQKLLIDWQALGIPLAHATFGMRGEKLDYSSLNHELIDEVVLGYGYRDHIVFHIKENIDISNYKQGEMLGKYFSLSVECDK